MNLTNAEKIAMHKDICNKLNHTYVAKNADYGSSFDLTYDKLGIISAITRISDKYNRLVALAMKPEQERKVKNESIRDTLLDMANYCIMTIMALDMTDSDNSVISENGFFTTPIPNNTLHSVTTTATSED